MDSDSEDDLQQYNMQGQTTGLSRDSVRRGESNTFGVKGDPSKRKRNREEALYGIFGEEGDEQGGGIGYGGRSISAYDSDDEPDDGLMDDLGGAKRAKYGGGNMAFVKANDSSDDNREDEEGADSSSDEEERREVSERSRDANEKFLELLVRGGGGKKSHHTQQTQHTQRTHVAAPSSQPPRESLASERASQSGVGSSSTGYDNFAAAGLGLATAAEKTPQFGGLGLGTATLPPPPSQEKPFDIQKSSLGKWEKHTKGFGAKMLSKMGFTGRLGSKAKGVSGTVGVVIRPNALGLGFGGFKEASKLEENKKMEVELKGGDYEEEKKRVRERAKQEEAKKVATAMRGAYGIDESSTSFRKSSSSSKKKSKKKKANYVSASDIMKEVERNADGGNDTLSKIVDMRGEQVKTYYGGDMSNVRVNEGSEGGTNSKVGPPLLGAELLHNLTMTINRSEEAIRSATHYKRLAASRVELHSREVKELQERSAEVESKKQRLEEIENLLSTISTDPANSSSNTKIDDVLSVFNSINDKYAFEYSKLQLVKLLPAYLTPILMDKLAGYSPLEDPSKISELFKVWKSALPSPNILLHLFDKFVNPLLNREIMNSWFPATSDPDPVIKIFTDFSSLLGKKSTKFLLDNTIMPKLTSAVEDWNPTVDETPIHSWLHPWLPHLPSSILSPLFPPIRRKLARTLKAWHPSDTSAFELFRKWKDVFDANSTANLLEKSIAPKLATAIRKELKIDPSSQDMKVLDCVCVWREMLGPHLWGCLVEGELLLPWINVLWRWVTTEGADLEEIKDFYFGWKEIVGVNVAEGDEHCCKYFYTGLRMIKSLRTESTSTVQKPPGKSTTCFADALEARSRILADRNKKNRTREMQERKLQNSFSNKRRSAFHEDPTVSIREVVESRCEELGLNFLMKDNTNVNGCQLFEFEENKLVYFKNNEIYLKLKGSSNSNGSGYCIVSYEELMN